MKCSFLSFLVACLLISCSIGDFKSGSEKGREAMFLELTFGYLFQGTSVCRVTPDQSKVLSHWEEIRVQCPFGYTIAEESLSQSIRYEALDASDSNSVSDFYWERISSEEVKLKSRSSDVSGKISFILISIYEESGAKHSPIEYSIIIDKNPPVATAKFPSGNYDISIFLTNQFDLEFSEPVTGADQLFNYEIVSSLGGSLTIRNIARLSDRSYRIFWQGSFPRSGGTLQLTIRNIKDGAGNAAVPGFQYRISGWKPGPNLNQPRIEFQAVTLSNGDILMLGGVISSTILRSVERYSESVNSFVIQNDISIGRRAFAASVTASDEIVLSGGYGTNVSNDAAMRNTTDIYNPNTGTWSLGPNLSSVRVAHSSCTLPDGRVLITGGRVNSASSSAPVKTSHIITLDHSGGGTIAHYNLLVARMGHTSVLLPNGKVWIAGYGKQTEYFDYQTNAFSLGPELAVSQDSMVTLQDVDGNVYLIGGTSGFVTDVVQKYDWRTEEVSIVSYMTKGRFKHTGVRLPDGNFLIMGGTLDELSASLAIVEKIWKEGGLIGFPLPPMAQRRENSQAVRLPSGRVMMIGGASGTGIVDYLLSTEIFGD